MKILVPVKRVVDYNVVVRPTKDGQDVDTDNVKMSINPFDEIALEEAVRLKESGKAKEIIAVTCGSDNCQDVLKTSFAMGADRGILINCSDNLLPISVAKILEKVSNIEKPNLILMGKQAIDDDCNQTGQMLAALLNINQATYASEVKIEGDELIVTREIDGGMETVRLSTPAVVTADLRLNEPRYITLPNIMKAKRKTIEKIDSNSLNYDGSTKIKLLKISEPETRKKGEFVDSVDELLQYLKKKSEILK